MTTAAADGGAVVERRFEVWGDPIAHSLSPALHGAAYRELGLPWHYGRRRVDESAFDEVLAGVPRELHGLSLTMPLKTRAFERAEWRDSASRLTGAANTLVRTDAGWSAFNTDVGGLVRALAEAGAGGAEHARIVGAGATATSAVVALHRTGVRSIDVAARRPEAAAPLVALAERLGLDARVSPLSTPGGPVDVTVSTLPGDAPVTVGDADSLAALGGILYDVVYGSWPTALAQAWQRHGLAAHPGMTMLLHQAVLQIRIFSSGGADEPLEREGDVVAVMRRALVGG